MSLNQKESNMTTPIPPVPKGTQYPREFCDICGGEIPLLKDGRLRIHRQRNHEFYGVPGAEIPTCPGSRTRLYYPKPESER